MRVLRYLRDAALFVPCYVALDWASYIDPLGPFNITPWNPQPALAIAWLLLGGPLYAPLVFLTIVIADLVVRHAAGGYLITLTTGLVLALGYTAMAWTLRRMLKPRPTLDSLRQLTLFVGVVLAGSAVVGGAFLGVLAASGTVGREVALQGWLRFWIGDAVGILVTAPLLLAVADAGLRRRLGTLSRRVEFPLQLAVVLATLWLIFSGWGDDPLRHFYLLFLPLIWIAARHGMPGAIVALGLVQLGVVLGIHREMPQPIALLDLQALVAALTLTGLYLGVMTDERERATASLTQSLRLAAAGEMAGAITHEINQPLTALTNYSRAAQTMIREGRAPAELAPVIDKMLGEASRAAEVVRRLRDFFRAGTTRLESIPVRELLRLAERIGQQLAAGKEVRFSTRADPDLPALYVDRMQIELVLRNLIANAVEAIELDGATRREVSVSVQRHNPRQVLIVVSDTGPGIAQAHAGRLFEPFFSAKPSGMGLGLAVSRSIVEAHGGSLEALDLGHGEFHLILPAAQPG